MANLYGSETYSADNLFGGNQIVPVSEEVTIAIGENLTRGAALGRVDFALGVPAADPGNTGNGTCVAVLVEVDDPPDLGAYSLACEVIADPGPPAVVAQFRFITPQSPQGVLVFADGNPQVVDGVQVTITQGLVAFDIADLFTFALAAGNKHCKQLDSSAVDGTQHIHGILSEDVDATAAAKVAVAYTQGEFSAQHVGFHAPDTAATFQDAARAKGILFRDTVAA